MALFNLDNQLFNNEVLKLNTFVMLTEDTADIDAATAIAATDETIFKDASATARAHTLADGAVNGDTVRMIKRGGAEVGTVTPATFTPGTSIPLTNAGDFVSLEWVTGDAVATNGVEGWEVKMAINLLTGAAIAVTA
jgi:hypothetical protein